MTAGELYTGQHWSRAAAAVMRSGAEMWIIWWSIFIAGQVRAASHEGEYGQTMAAFRVPRSVVTSSG